MKEKEVQGQCFAGIEFGTESRQQGLHSSRRCYGVSSVDLEVSVLLVWIRVGENGAAGTRDG